MKKNDNVYFKYRTICLTHSIGSDMILYKTGLSYCKPAFLFNLQIAVYIRYNSLLPELILLLGAIVYLFISTASPCFKIRTVPPNTVHTFVVWRGRVGFVQASFPTLLSIQPVTLSRTSPPIGAWRCNSAVNMTGSNRPADAGKLCCMCGDGRKHLSSPMKGVFHEYSWIWILNNRVI